MKKHLLILSVCMISICFSCIQTGNKQKSETSTTSDSEWISLFDGNTLQGWRSFQSDTITGWIVEDNSIMALGEGDDLSGDIITKDQFGNFELELEWKIAPEGNSGILYHVVEGNHEATYETGPEYQLIDDEGFPGDLGDWQRTGANYAMHVTQIDATKPVGEWNTAKIIVNGNHVEHWLNGTKIVEFEMNSEDWNKRVENGKWKDYPDYAKAEKGHIALQDHGSKVWFRNIRIREL